MSPDDEVVTVVVSRRELLALVRELRRVDRLPADAQAAVMARKRAMVERLVPGWYEDLEEEGVAADEIELDMTEHLESLAAGYRGHPDVERRPSDPQSAEWAAMVEQSRARHATAVEALVELELNCAATGGSFPDNLRSVLEALASRLGGSEELVETRPGCWEADHIRALAAGADWSPEGDPGTWPNASPEQANDGLNAALDQQRPAHQSQTQVRPDQETTP